jgi:transposase InsO family protein
MLLVFWILKVIFVCTIIHMGQIFKADFSQCVGSFCCLVTGISVELWKWHRRLGHLSFNLLSRLSGLGLVRGLLKLKYQKDLVCALCRHGKMVATSHFPLTDVMTKRPRELFHMDLVGPARVCSAGGKFYVLVIVDDYSCYAWVFFLADKGETFGFVRDLILRLKNERHGDVVRAICSDNGTEFKNSQFETFCHDLGLKHQFCSPYVVCQNGVVERKKRYVKTSNRSRSICNGPLTPVTYTHICNGCCLVPVTYKSARTTLGLASTTPVTNVNFW